MLAYHIRVSGFKGSDAASYSDFLPVRLGEGAAAMARVPGSLSNMQKTLVGSQALAFSLA